MSNPKPAMSLFFLALTILGLYVLASILSFSILMTEWHAFSNIIFWGASIILTVWNFNDYFINPEKENTDNSKPNDNYIVKQKQTEDKFVTEELNDLGNKIYPNVTPKPESKKEDLSDYQQEMPASLKKIIETRERMKSTIAEIKRLDKEISESDYEFERVSSINEVRIGRQIWAAKNLNVVKFKNGDKIQETKTCIEWTDCLKQKKPAFCYYENNKEFADGYGKLYNYYAIIDERGLAPEGWSIPSAKDWLELKNYIKKDDFDCTVGEALKSEKQVNSILGGEEALDEHPRWDENMNNLGQDLYNYQAFPGGFRGADEEATFSNIGRVGYWCTTTHDDSEGYDSILLAILSVLSPHLHLDGFSERVGASIRLVKYESNNPQ